MLIQFTVGNYRSFKEEQTLSMVATRVLGPEECVRDAGRYKLLTSAAIYGANASGKSNLIKAVGFMYDFIMNPSSSLGYMTGITVVPFRLATDTLEKPSHFELIFLHEGVTYRYGFEVAATKITREWLYHTPSSRESMLFERDEANITLRTALIGERKLFKKTRIDRLFLHTLAQFENPIAKRVVEWFQEMKIMHGMYDEAFYSHARDALENEVERLKITEFLKEYDTGIYELKAGYPEFELLREQSLSREEHQKTKKPRTIHTMHDEGNNQISAAEFFLREESEGTQKLFILALPVLDALKKGDILVIDEMDARLHPIITDSIIRLFQQRSTNPKGAQLIFATHDTNILNADLLRRDQVWFTEKNRCGATDIYSLVEYKPRKQENYEKNYIQGRYGAIPFVGGVERLMVTNDEE